eukprot:UN15199
MGTLISLLCIVEIEFKLVFTFYFTISTTHKPLIFATSYNNSTRHGCFL